MFLTAILRRKQAARLFTIAFLMFFSDIKNQKWNSHKGHYNYDDFASTKYFPVKDANKSTKGKASFIGVADVQ